MSESMVRFYASRRELPLGICRILHFNILDWFRLSVYEQEAEANFINI